MKKLALVNLTEDEIDDMSRRISYISYRLKGIGEAKRSVDIYMECIDFVRDRLGRLGCDDSLSLTGDDLRLNHFIICRLLIDLGTVYLQMACSSGTDSRCISYLSEARELLLQRRDAGMNEAYMWQLLLICDIHIYKLYLQSRQGEKAKYHAVEWVATARQCDSPNQVEYLSTALNMLSCSFGRECNFAEARALAEESYTIASRHILPPFWKVFKNFDLFYSCIYV